MLKRLVIMGLFFCISTISFAGPLWHCTAENDHGAVWNRFASTHEDARYIPERICNSTNPRNKPCSVICFPPREYWRCLSHDMPSAGEKSGMIGKVGTWYWTSFSKQIAINGARDACRHNSEYGGCYVNPNACSEA